LRLFDSKPFCEEFFFGDTFDAPSIALAVSVMQR
jgi:hypothetical protein